MSAPTPNQRLPNLGDLIAVGTGKLNGGLKLRQTSGTETGSLLADLEVIHTIATIEQAREIEPWLPGAVGAFQRAHGEDSDGVRPLEWKPAKADCMLILCAAGGGLKAFEGAAEVKRAVLRILPKACVLTLYLRLHSVDEDANLPPLAGLLGEAIDYERTVTTLSGPVSEDQGPLFAQGDPTPAIGDLVVGPDGDDDVLRVSAVNEDGSVTGALMLDGSEVRTVEKAGIFGVHRLCGAKGGPPENAIRKLRDRAQEAGIENLSAADLQAALVAAVDTGLIEEGPSGLPLTTEFLEFAIEDIRDRRKAAELPPEV